MKAVDEAVLCFLQDRNLFYGKTINCTHFNSTKKTVDHLITRSDRMLSFDYTKRHNQVIRCIHLLICIRYDFQSSKKMLNHFVQEIVCNDDVEINVDKKQS
ncbi:hypothetical protein NUSPORA_00699 [Nucleospora cyclopteri]